MEKTSLLDIGNVVRDIGFYVLKCCMLNELINFLTMNPCRIFLCVVLFSGGIPALSQKAVRSDFFEMLNRITLQEKIGLDNYFTRSFANMMDHGTII